MVKILLPAEYETSLFCTLKNHQQQLFTQFSLSETKASHWIHYEIIKLKNIFATENIWLS